MPVLSFFGPIIKAFVFFENKERIDVLSFDVRSLEQGQNYWKEYND